jgi:hypothetical protein
MRKLNSSELAREGLDVLPDQVWYSLGSWAAVKKAFNLHNDQRVMQFLQEHRLLLVCTVCPQRPCQERTHDRMIWGPCKLL